MNRGYPLIILVLVGLAAAPWARADEYRDPAPLSTSDISDRIFEITDKRMASVGGGMLMSKVSPINFLIRVRAVGASYKGDRLGLGDGVLMLARVRADTSVIPYGGDFASFMNVDFVPVSYGTTIDGDMLGGVYGTLGALPTVYTRDLALDTENQLEISILRASFRAAAEVPGLNVGSKLPIFVARVTLDALGLKLAKCVDLARIQGWSLAHFNMEVGLLLEHGFRFSAGLDLGYAT